MLYDPKWDRIFTLSSFSSWLATKPKDEKYSFIDIDNCAAAQYLKANELDPDISCDRIRDLGWMEIVCTGGRYETFGGAATRARLILRGGWRLRVARFFGIAGL